MDLRRQGRDLVMERQRLGRRRGVHDQLDGGARVAGRVVYQRSGR
jgi:hypothetical protein